MLVSVLAAALRLRRPSASNPCRYVSAVHSPPTLLHLRCHGSVVFCLLCSLLLQSVSSSRSLDADSSWLPTTVPHLLASPVPLQHPPYRVRSPLILSPAATRQQLSPSISLVHELAGCRGAYLLLVCCPPPLASAGTARSPPSSPGVLLIFVSLWLVRCTSRSVQDRGLAYSARRIYFQINLNIFCQDKISLKYAGLSAKRIKNNLAFVYTGTSFSTRPINLCPF